MAVPAGGLMKIYARGTGPPPPGRDLHYPPAGTATRSGGESFTRREVSEGTAIPAVHVLEISSLIYEEHPTLIVEPGWYEVASAANDWGR